MVNGQQRLRNWCFTGYLLDATYRRWGDDEKFPDEIRGLVYQQEKCPESGRLHIQGYVEFNKPIRLNRVKNIFGDPGLHLESRKGTSAQAIAYCEKSESYDDSGIRMRYGDFKKEQGARNDLSTIGEAIISGETISSIAFANPGSFIRYGRGFDRLAFIAAKRGAQEFRKLTVVVLWGVAGCGKSRAAIQLADGDGFILDQPTGGVLWFDGYEGEKTLIIDDFYGWIKYAKFLKVLDGHCLRNQTKGGYNYASWDKVIITSNKGPADWYQAGFTPALERRINYVLEMKDPLDFSTPIIGQLGLEGIY